MNADRTPIPPGAMRRFFVTRLAPIVGVSAALASCAPEAAIQLEIQRGVQDLKDTGITYLAGRGGGNDNTQFSVADNAEALDFLVESLTWEYPEIADAPQDHATLVASLVDASHFFSMANYWLPRRDTLTPAMGTTVHSIRIDGSEYGAGRFKNGYAYVPGKNPGNELMLLLPNNGQPDASGQLHITLNALVHGLIVRNQEKYSKHIAPIIKGAVGDEVITVATNLITSMLLNDKATLQTLIDGQKVSNNTDALLDQVARFMDDATTTPSFNADYKVLITEIQNGADPVTTASTHFGW